MRGPRSTQNEAYQRGELLGEGRVSSVYLCLNKTSGQLVAMRQFSRRRFAAAAGAKTEEEYGVLDELYATCGLRMCALIEEFRGLDNRHIVKYLGGEKIDDSFCIFSEYIPGGSIASLLKRFGPLSEMVAHSYSTQLFDAMEYLHSRKIVHGNISTRHILVASDGTIKLSGYASSFQSALSKRARRSTLASSTNGKSGGEPRAHGVEGEREPSATTTSNGGAGLSRGGAVFEAAAGSASLGGRSRSSVRMTADVRCAAHAIVQMITAEHTLRWTDALAAELNAFNAPAEAGFGGAGDKAAQPSPHVVCLAQLSIEAQRFMHAMLRSDATAHALVQHPFLQGRCSPRARRSSSDSPRGGGINAPGNGFGEFGGSSSAAAMLLSPGGLHASSSSIGTNSRRHTGRIGVISYRGTTGGGEEPSPRGGVRTAGGFDAILSRAHGNAERSRGSATPPGAAAASPRSGLGLPRIQRKRSGVHSEEKSPLTPQHHRVKHGFGSIARKMSGGAGSPLASRHLRRSPSFGSSSIISLAGGDSLASSTMSSIGGGLDLKERPMIPTLDFGALRVDGSNPTAAQGGGAGQQQGQPLDAREKAQKQFMKRFERRSSKAVVAAASGTNIVTELESRAGGAGQGGGQQQQLALTHGGRLEVGSSSPSPRGSLGATTTTRSKLSSPNYNGQNYEKSANSPPSTGAPMRRKGKSRLSPLSVGHSVQWAVSHRGITSPLEADDANADDADAALTPAVAGAVLVTVAEKSPAGSSGEKKKRKKTKKKKKKTETPLVMQGQSAEPHKAGQVNLFRGTKKRTLKQGRFLKSLGMESVEQQAPIVELQQVAAPGPEALASGLSGNAFGPDASVRSQHSKEQRSLAAAGSPRSLLRLRSTPRNQNRSPRARFARRTSLSGKFGEKTSSMSVTFSTAADDLEPLPFPVGTPQYEAARLAREIDSRIARKVQDEVDVVAVSSEISESVAKDVAIKMWLELAGNEPLFLSDTSILVAQLWLAHARDRLEDRALDDTTESDEDESSSEEEEPTTLTTPQNSSPAAFRPSLAQEVAERAVTPPYLSKKPPGGLSLFFGTAASEPAKEQEQEISQEPAKTPPYLKNKPPGGLSIFFGAAVEPEPEAAPAQAQIAPSLERAITPPYLAHKPPGGLSLFFNTDTDDTDTPAAATSTSTPASGATTSAAAFDFNAASTKTTIDEPFQASPASAGNGGFHSPGDFGGDENEEEPGEGVEEEEAAIAFCIAIAEYAGDEEGGELILREGEDVWILEKDESGWWRGATADGARGWFPSTYVEQSLDESASWIADESLSASVIGGDGSSHIYDEHERAASDDAAGKEAEAEAEAAHSDSYTAGGNTDEAAMRVWAIGDYESQTEGELSFTENEGLWVIEQDESGWWKGQNEAGEEGWFPSTFVEVEAPYDADSYAVSGSGSGSVAGAGGAGGVGDYDYAGSEYAGSVQAGDETQSYIGGDGESVTYDASSFWDTQEGNAQSVVRALQAYTAMDETELSFREGELIWVVEQNDSGWWYGRKRGTGTVIGAGSSSSSSSSIPGVDNARNGGLSGTSTEGDNAGGNNTSNANDGVTEGWFPSTFVAWSVLDDDASTVAGEQWGLGGYGGGAQGQSGGAGGTVRALMAYDASEASELSLQLGEELTVVEDDDGSGWLQCTNASGAEGWVASNYVEWITVLNNVAEEEGS